MIPDSFLEAAASWLAERRWTHGGDGQCLTPATTVARRRDELIRMFKARRASHPSGDFVIGHHVATGPLKDGKIESATVHIRPDGVFGVINDPENFIRLA